MVVLIRKGDGESARFFWSLVEEVWRNMTNGPIEFLSDPGPEHVVPSTEMGGADGLIQPEFVGGVEAHSGLTAEEARGILVRAGSVPLVGSERWTGESLSGDVIVDPATGRALPDDLHKDITGMPAREVDLSKGMTESKEVGG